MIYHQLPLIINNSSDFKLPANYSIMLALSPPSWFSNVGPSYFGQYSISQDQNHVHRDNDSNLESALHFLSDETVHEVCGLDPETSAQTPVSGDPKIVRKLNHNASERDRRKKMNGLYCSLRSLLPEADQMVLLIPHF